MSGEFLYSPGETRVHRCPAHVKLLAALATLIVIVATPGRAVWAFAVYFALVLVILGLARLSVRLVLPRLAVELPFLVFAVLLPFLGTDPRIQMGPVSLSEPGLWAAWTLAAKATLGVLIAIALSATTSTTELLDAMRRLRVPDLFVQILTAMVRYIHVVGQESSRMSRARAARGFSAKGVRSWPVLGLALGTLFIRSYERGERVHCAMLSRGYSGQPPRLREVMPVSIGAWVAAAALPASALSVLAVAVHGPAT